jgi:hypothetical protein
MCFGVQEQLAQNSEGGLFQSETTMGLSFHLVSNIYIWMTPISRRRTCLPRTLDPSTLIPCLFGSLQMADVFASILKLGEAVGAAATARALVEQLQARLRAVAGAVAGAAHRPRVLSLEGLHPLVLGGHWLPEMKILAGGVDGLQVSAGIVRGF